MKVGITDITLNSESHTRILYRLPEHLHVATCIVLLEFYFSLTPDLVDDGRLSWHLAYLLLILTSDGLVVWLFPDLRKEGVARADL